MKTADKKALQTKTKEELQVLANEAYTTLNQLTLDNAQGKLKNTRSVFNTRKEIAVIKSLLSAKLKEKEEK
jgi:ribosomal protein L29